MRQVCPACMLRFRFFSLVMGKVIHQCRMYLGSARELEVVVQLTSSHRSDCLYKLLGGLVHLDTEVHLLWLAGPSSCQKENVKKVPRRAVLYQPVGAAVILYSRASLETVFLPCLRFIRCFTASTCQRGWKNTSLNSLRK